MKSVTDALIDNFHSGNQKYVTLTFSDETALTNEEIVIESLGIEQTICDETALVFGNVYAGAFSIQIFDRGKNYKGLTVDVSISVDEYSMSLGSYIITSNPVDDNTGYRTLVGYDRMYPILRTDYSAWHYALPDTVNTIKKFRDAFFQEIGITQQTVSLVNDNVPYTPMVHEGTLSGAEILKAILETNGTMGYLDFDQTFHYVTLRDCTATDNALYPSMTLYPSMGVYPASADATSEVVSDAEEKVLDGSYLLGGLGYERYMTENYLVVDLFAGQSEYTAGTTGLTYTVQSNVLTENMSQTDATAVAAGILSVIADVTYTPTTLTMLASPWIELGDVILVKAKDGTLVAFPVLHRSMSGITFLKDTYEALGIETEQNNPNTVKQQIIDAKNFASQYATKYLYETEDGDLIQAPDAPSSDTEAATMTGYYTKIVSSGAEAGFDVYEGDGTTNQKRVAHYGADAVIGAEDEAHTTIGHGRMMFDDDAQNLMFMGRTNNDATGKAICQLSIPLDHKTVVGNTWELTETSDLSFPTQTVSEVIGVAFMADDMQTLTAPQWTATIEDGLLTKITITELGVNRITEYMTNYEEVSGFVVKFLTTDSVQTYVLDNANNDNITPASPTMQTRVPGDGAFSVGGGLASGDDSVAMAGGWATGKRSFAFGYSDETGSAMASKEGEVRFKSPKMVVEGEFMTFCEEVEKDGWTYNTSVVDATNSKVSVYGIGDYVRIDGDILTSASVPSGTRLINGLPLSLFAGRDYDYSGNPPRMRTYGKIDVSGNGLITGTSGVLQAIIVANQWTDAGSITIPGAGLYMVRFSFNMTDNKGTGHITAQINYGESNTTGVRNRQSVYFNNSGKDLCMTVTTFITTTGSASVPCRIYSTFGTSEPDNAYVCIQACCLSGGTAKSEVAELTLMNMEDFDSFDTSRKACLLNNGKAIPAGVHVKFGMTYVRNSLWDGGYNG